LPVVAVATVAMAIEVLIAADDAVVAAFDAAVAIAVVSAADSAVVLAPADATRIDVVRAPADAGEALALPAMAAGPPPDAITLSGMGGAIGSHIASFNAFISARDLPRFHALANATEPGRALPPLTVPS